MRGFFGGLLGVVLASAASGCAYTNETVHLEHPAAAYKGAKVSGAPLTMVLLDDARSDVTRVGVVKNGTGSESASVLTPDNVPTVVSNAVKTELEAAGFSIQTANRADAKPENGRLVLRGSLVKAMAEPVSSGTIAAEVVIDVELLQGGTTRARQFVGHGSGTTRTFSVANSFKGALEDAITEAAVEIARSCVEVEKSASP